MKKIFENIGWLFFERILRILVGLLISVWLARYLGPKQFGILNYAISFVGLFGVIAGLGLQSVVVRDIVRHPDRVGETLGSAAGLQLLGGIFSYSLVLGAAVWIKPDDELVETLIIILGMTLLFKVSEVATYWFEAKVLSKNIVWVQSACFLAFSIVKVSLIISKAPLISFVWAIVLEALVVAALTLLVLRIRGEYEARMRCTIKRSTELLKDSWPFLLSGASIMTYMKIDQIMLGQMIGNEALGAYAAAVKISESFYFISTIIVASVFPAIIEAKRRGEAFYYNHLQQLYDLMLWLSFLFALPMTFFSSTIVNVVYGEGFEASGTVLAIHIWSSIFVFLGVASNKWFVIENKQVWLLQRAVLGAVANIILNFFLIPELSGVGAAIATIVSYAIVAVISDYFRQGTRNMFNMKVRSMNLPSSFIRLWLGAQRR